MTDTLSLAELGTHLRDRRLRSVDLAEHALAAQRLGAYRTVDSERTRSMALAADAALDLGAWQGPLHGVPVSLKDLFGVEGWPTFAGTPVALSEAFQRSGPVAARLVAQLAVITGKTHTVELAFGGIGTNPHAGTPINPWDASVERVPGGSSAGAGVSLQEGSAVVALGTDTAGSVRIPAAWTGTVGLKTTVGRWSTSGVVPLSTTLDTVGILTRTVADAVTAFRALDDHAAEVFPTDLSAVRWSRGPEPLWDSASPGVVECVEAALAEAGVVLGPSVLDACVSEALELFGQGGPVSAELDAFLEWELPHLRETLDPNVAARVEAASGLPVREYLRRRHRLAFLAMAARQVFQDVDVVVTPTVANTPPTVSSLEDPAVYRSQNLLCLRNTSVANYLGLCALTLPCGLDAAGMPVGLQLLAAPHREERLLSVGSTLEHVLGTSRERLGVPPRVRE